MTENQQIVVSDDDKKKMLQSAIYHLTNQQAFYGQLLQELTIKYNHSIPTAGITFNKKVQQFEVYINPNFFASLKNEERIAVFHHEVLHFTNKHLFRLPFLDDKVTNEEKKMYNIGGDMAINQYIKNLPQGCVDVKDWKMDDGSLFPTFNNMETYYELIKSESKQQKKSNEKKEKGEGQGTKGNVNDHLDNYKEFDVHMWDSLDEETKKQMLDEAKKIIKRTIEKTSYNHSNVPDSMKDLLEEIEGLTASINYKEILRSVIKKTVSSVDRDTTWKKPNRRYGIYSPGSKVGNTPKLAFLNDSSGSISVKEQNEYLRIMDQFLKVGSRNCILGFWHTNLYYKKPYKKGQEVNKDELQSGGTDVTSIMEDIKKHKYDLSIILTDGYYDACDIKASSEVIWIISSGGNPSHPMMHVGKTIMLDKLK
jgi:predicted metal-dependent peptidase